MRLEISFNICRICLQNTNDDMFSIYEPIIGKDGVSNGMLYHRIEGCGGIEVLTNPELPNKICKRCNVFLNIAYKFRTICKSSDKYLREFACQTSRYSEVANFDKVGHGVDGEAEYLLEYNPEPGNSTVAQVLQQAGHDIDESQTNFNYEEIDEYSDILNDNEDENDPQHFAAVDRKIGSVTSPTSEMLRHSNRSSRIALERSTRNIMDRTTRKTLDISSDGAAVLRVKSSHRFMNHEKQIHICDVCGNSYNRKYALDAHMRRHRNEKPFECEICQKAFHLNFQLTRHIRKHTGARPYSCQYCKRSFADRSTMVKHERIHRNERPYTCETCGKSFTYSNVLKVHMLTHTGEKPFICGICDKRFARAHHLRAHLETLQHQSDPRSKLLLKQIKREAEQSYGDE